MDAHVFRRFCAVLTELLHDARLEKIQSPAADVHIFTFYAQQSKHILVVRHDRRNPLLFLSPQRYSTGQAPPASTMRLRKYAAGRRVKAVRVDWLARRLHMCFQLPAGDKAGLEPRRIFPTSVPKDPSSPACAALACAEHFYVGNEAYTPPPETWITLDLRQGPELTLGKAPDFGQEAQWPTPAEVAACLQPLLPQAQGEVPVSDAPHAWEQWPVLTPALRRTLLHLDPPEQGALLADLEYGGGDIFVYSAAQEGGHASASCAPLLAGASALVAPDATPDTSPNTSPNTSIDASPFVAPDVALDARPAVSTVASPDNSCPAGPADVTPHISPPHAASPVDFVAWPLPPTVRGARREQIYEDPVAALATAGAHLVLGGLERAGQSSAASPHKREAKRLSRVLEKLEREESRLHAMVAGKDRALYVQSVLWYFAPDARPADLAQSPACRAGNPPAGSAPCAQGSHGGEDNGKNVGISASGAELPPCPFDPLDPRLLQAHLSLRDNMEALFHSAARGQRGLAMLEQRRALLRGQVTAAEGAALLAINFGGLAPLPSGTGGKTGTAKGQQALQKGKAPLPGPKAGQQAVSPQSTVGQRILPKNVEAFTSVDGLLILRGKDAKGNLALLKLGAPSDLWLHVEGGPGAHTLVRRASVGQEVPQTTLEQAATLAAIKSWQKGNERVGVQCAEVRHVKPMRGAAMGTVRIDKVACMVWVNMPLLPT